jgi:hypothetical protein
VQMWIKSVDCNTHLKVCHKADTYRLYFQFTGSFSCSFHCIALCKLNTTCSITDADTAIKTVPQHIYGGVGGEEL